MITLGTEGVGEVETTPISPAMPAEANFPVDTPTATAVGTTEYNDGLFPPLGLVGTPSVAPVAEPMPTPAPSTALSESDGLFSPFGLLDASAPSMGSDTTGLAMATPIAIDPMLLPMDTGAIGSVMSMPIAELPLPSPISMSMPLILPVMPSPPPPPPIPVFPVIETPQAAPIPMNTGAAGTYGTTTAATTMTAGARTAPVGEAGEEGEEEAAPTVARGGGSGDIASTFQIQYQNDGDLDTYGDSEDENDYSEIPAESYSENADGSLTLSANNDGGGSDNSKYSRTELREKSEWEIMSGTHSMQAEYTEITGGRQTIMQIHFSDDAKNPDEPPLRLEIIDGELVVETRRTAGMESSEETSIGSASVPLDVEMKVVDGTAQIIIDGEVRYEEALDWEGQGETAYFKAGTYNHSEGETSVTMSSVDISHS